MRIWRPFVKEDVMSLTRRTPSFDPVAGNDVIDAKTLPQVKMPNRDNFILPYRDRI